MISPIFKLALGALWTAGYRPELREKTDLERACGGYEPRDFQAYLRDGGAREACGVLASLGFALSETGRELLAAEPRHAGALGSGRRSLRLVEPLPQPIEAARPMAGDAVRFAEPWERCELVHLQGVRGEERRGFTIANARGSWHSQPVGEPGARGVFSMGSGGPASIAYLDTRELVATGERVELRLWAFAYRPEAHTGVDWLLDVPIWQGERAAFIDWQMAEGLGE